MGNIHGQQGKGQFLTKAKGLGLFLLSNARRSGGGSIYVFVQLFFNTLKLQFNCSATCLQDHYIRILCDSSISFIAMALSSFFFIFIIQGFLCPTHSTPEIIK